MEQSYKEKYEQALSKAKDMLNYKEVRREDMEYLFPELKESEDEKVRKALIKLFEIENLKRYVLVDGIDIEDVLGWLERQGEHANFLSKIQVGDKVTRNENGVLVNLSQLKRVAKPADKIEPKFKVGDKIYLKPEYRMPDDDTPIANTVKEIRRIDDKHYRFDGSYIFIEDQDKYELVEQEPEENKGNIGGISPNSAWSEEDSQYVEDTIALIGFGHSAHTIGQVQEWLQSLKGRVQPQPKQEWSEEDEDYLFLLNSICKDAEEKYRNSPDVLVRKEIANARDWLKSLRPQSRWKPTDEQMGCLSDAIEHYNSLGYPAPKLKELLDDLKKLKGEV